MQPALVRIPGIAIVATLTIFVFPAVARAQSDRSTRTARISGEVRNEAGAPVQWPQFSVISLGRAVIGDSLGRFAITNLPAGPVRVQLRRIGLSHIDTTFVLSDGQHVEWHPTLKPQPAVFLGRTPEDIARAAAAGAIDSVAIGRVTLDTSLAFDYASFGTRLLAASVRKAPDSNRVLSPFSAGQALALAMAASKDSTTIIMARGLGLGRLDQKELANRTRRFNRSLVDRKDLTLSVANAFWVDTSETLQPELTSWARDYYDASIRTIPLHSKTIGKTLNAWADSATRGRIKRIRDQPFADSVKAVLTNAVYLKGSWLTPFETKLTKDAHFTTARGDRPKVPLMHGGGKLGYRREHGYQVVRLPYRTGLTAMYVVLPAAGMPAAAVVDSLERYGWPTPSPRTERYDVSLALPRFHVEQRTDLVPPLTAIGMGIMFDSARADFGGLLRPSPHRPPPCPPISQGVIGGYCTRVRIDEATQNAFIDVNEEGTEAAAVTLLSFEVVAVSAGPPPIPFVVDRPFFFAIRDERTGTLLFTGYVADPKR